LIILFGQLLSSGKWRRICCKTYLEIVVILKINSDEKVLNSILIEEKLALDITRESTT
jgi:hypothetical protein